MHTRDFRARAELARRRLASLAAHQENAVECDHTEWRSITGPLGRGRQCMGCGLQRLDERSDDVICA